MTNNLVTFRHPKANPVGAVRWFLGVNGWLAGAVLAVKGDEVALGVFDELAHGPQPLVVSADAVLAEVGAVDSHPA
jgi:hypothetical protein